VEIRTSYFRNVFRNPRADILFLRVSLETIVFILVAAHEPRIHPDLFSYF
jgi:hypothetical protein